MGEYTVWDFFLPGDDMGELFHIVGTFVPWGIGIGAVFGILGFFVWFVIDFFRRL